MIPDNYLSNIRGFETEIQMSLSADEKKKVKFFANDGRGDLLRFLSIHREEILKYAGSTPQARAKVKKWNEDKEYSLLLKLSALIIFQLASYFACRIEADGVGAGNKYRDFAASIGTIILDTARQDYPSMDKTSQEFPWEDYTGRRY
jgi:hypothetical protein